MTQLVDWIVAVSLIIMSAIFFIELKYLPSKFIDIPSVVFKKVIMEVILFPIIDQGICSLEVNIINIIKT